MTWRADVANERVRDKAGKSKASDIEVESLSREMNLDNLTATKVKRANAAHFYADVVNFHQLIRETAGDLEKQKRLIRAASVLRRVQTELAAEHESGGIGRIQMQAARFHGIAFKPYDGEECTESDRVFAAVTFAITLQTYLYSVFNVVFEKTKNLSGSVGIDSGESIIARIGYHGDRSLICLGTPANLAAKCIGGGNSIVITKRVYDLLPSELQNEFSKAKEQVANTDVFVASELNWVERRELADKLGISFNEAKWTKKTTEYKKNRVLKDMEIAGCNGAIDIDALTENNSKRTHAVMIYADIDGFTNHVLRAEQDGDEAIKSLIRTFDLIRSEFHACIEACGYEGIAIQHQGDCVLAIAMMPCGVEEDAKRNRRGLGIATAIQSSMHHVLPDHIDGIGDLTFVVGADAGTVLVSRLGKQGDREVVCFAPEVTNSQKLQMESVAMETRISACIYDAIDDDILKAQFKKDNGSYIGESVTFPNLDVKRELDAAKKRNLGATASSGNVRPNYNAPKQDSQWSRDSY